MTTSNVPKAGPGSGNYNFANATDIHLSVYQGAATNTVYADTVEQTSSSSTAVTEVFRISNVLNPPNTAWSPVLATNTAGMTVPLAAAIPGGINPGGQGEFNSPITADPSNPDGFYIAGDYINGGVSASVFKVTINGGLATWAPVVGPNAPGPGPISAPLVMPGTANPLPANGGLAAPMTYQYAYTLVDSNGVESALSPSTTTMPLMVGQDQVTITIPLPLQAGFATARGFRVYRYFPNSLAYYLVGGGLFGGAPPRRTISSLTP